MSSEKLAHDPPGPRLTGNHEPLAVERPYDAAQEKDSAADLEAGHPNGVPIQKQVTAQDWSGPDDPEDPLNWSMAKKSYYVFSSALYALAVTFGSSAYSPAVPDISREFGVSNTAAYVGVTLWVLGLGLGPTLGAPISETVGRVWIYRLTLPISMLFTLGAGFSKSFGSLLVCRAFGGIFGGPVMSVGAGTLADIFVPRQRSVAAVMFTLAPFLGTVLGPAANGYAVLKKGWTWSQWTMLFLQLVAYLISLPMVETYKKIILKKRAKRLNIEPPKSPLPPGLPALKFLLTVTLVRPIHMLFFEPIVLFLSLYSAYTFGVLFAFLPAFPIAFTGVYGFNLGETGLAFFALAIGYVLAVPTVWACDKYLYQPRHRQIIKEGKHTVQPEHRLYSAMFGSFGVTVGLFWFGWTARRSIHWIVPMIGVIPFTWGNLTVFNASAIYVIDVYGALNGASAIGANSLLRYIFAAAFPLFTTQMYDALGIGWATSILGFASLVLLPIPFILFKFGPRIRSKSHYDTLKVD